MSKRDNTRPGGKNTSGKTEKGKKVQIIKLEQGLDKAYLCAHVCAALKMPRIASDGKELCQKAMDTAIKAEATANEHVWGYLAEVGYNMRFNPPRPLMSLNPERSHLPSSYPLGASKKQIENYTKGSLRIPDVTVLKVTSAEMIAMRRKRIVDWNKFYPIEKNIKTIVEVKFKKDVWGVDQHKAYCQIANNRVRELRDTDCCCDTRKPQTQHVHEFLPILNPTPHAKERLIPTPLHLYLKQESMLDKLFKTPPKLEFVHEPTPWEEFQKVAVPVAIGTAVTAGVIFGEIVTAGLGSFAVVGFVALANN